MYAVSVIARPIVASERRGVVASTKTSAMANAFATSRVGPAPMCGESRGEDRVHLAVALPADVRCDPVEELEREVQGDQDREVSVPHDRTRSNSNAT